MTLKPDREQPFPAARPDSRPGSTGRVGPRIGHRAPWADPSILVEALRTASTILGYEQHRQMFRFIPEAISASLGGQQGDGGHDHSGRAVAALERPFLQERLPDRVELLALSPALRS